MIWLNNMWDTIQQFHAHYTHDTANDAILQLFLNNFPIFQQNSAEIKVSNDFLNSDTCQKVDQLRFIKPQTWHLTIWKPSQKTLDSTNSQNPLIADQL